MVERSRKPECFEYEYASPVQARLDLVPLKTLTCVYSSHIPSQPYGASASYAFVPPVLLKTF